MKTITKKLIAVLVALTMVLILAACGSKNNDGEEGSVSASQIGATADSTPSSTNTDMFTERDLDPSYDSAETIDLSKESGSKVTITKEGTYVLTGTYKGQVVVKVGDSDKVQLVLKNASISNSDGAAIYVQSGDKVFVTLADGTTNSVSSGASFSEADSETGDKVDGAIFSKATLVFNGTGTLNVTSDHGHGIVSKDDLKVTGGTLVIKAAEKGLAGKDSVRVHDGKLDITAGDDAIHTSNDEEEGKGFIYIEGGDFTLSSGDDAIHAETDLTITGGVIDVKKSEEGLEGRNIDISGGVIDIVASDDGINAAEGSSGKDNTDSFGGFGHGGGFADNQNATLIISGGTINVNAGGDGLDSNGSLVVSGGKTYVSGPTNGGNGAIDCDNASISAGTVIAAGAVGMDINFGSDSTQCSMLVQFDSKVAGGTEVVLKDSSGNTLLSYTPKKDYQSVVLSSPDIKVGETYTVTAGNQSKTVEMTDTIYGTGNPMGGGGMGGQRPGGNQFGGQRSEGEQGGRGGFYGRPGNISEGSGDIDSQSSATL
ncbi:MAG: carbohydrate-binding domain-containing protein [Clostridia bacterium]|nr:carbohydrate-binding domain-containing protein [Clostridia bacterium]